MPSQQADVRLQVEHERAAFGAGAEPLVEQELLVEDVSIDGTCGVY